MKTPRTALRTIGTILAILFGGCAFLYVVVASFPGLSSRVARAAAHVIVTHCAERNDKPLCYEENVPLLLYVSPIEGVFSVVRALQREDTSYRFCHVLGHELGAALVKQNPDQWVDLMHKNPPDGLCSNGFLHGIIVGRFNYAVLSEEQIDAIVPDFAEACERAPGWEPSDLDRAMCYHALGHVLTHLTSADLSLAADYCGAIAQRRGREAYVPTCVSGVFMQIFQPLEPEDYALIERLPVKPTKETLLTFCAAYNTEQKRGQCFSEGWPLFRDELQTAAGTQAFCQSSKDSKIQEICYRTVFSIGARFGISNPSARVSLCEQMPKGRVPECIGILANAFIEEDRTKGADASAACALASPEYQDGCYTYLLSMMRFNLVEGSPSRQALCAALPPEYAKKCTLLSN